MPTFDKIPISASLNMQRTNPQSSSRLMPADAPTFREVHDAPAHSRILLGVQVLVAAPENWLREAEPDSALSAGLRDQIEERIEVEIHPEDRET